MRYFSSTVITRSTGTFSSTCLVPLGHVTVSLSTFVAAAQPEMHPRIVLRQIARSGGALVLLPVAARDHLDLRADSVAIALVPDQLHRNPVVRRRRDIVQQKSRAAQVHDEDVDLAVVVVVGEGGAAAHALHVEEWTRRERHVLELPVPHIAEHRVLLRNHVDQPAVHDEDVVAAVVVEIVRSGAPAHVLRGEL